MADTTSPDGTEPRGIAAVGVRGYKSLYEQQSIEIRPLTIIAGVNSSGKSSLLQPLLLMKQTLEAPFDPGPLLLDGPHVSITSLDQVLSTGGPGVERATSFEVFLAVQDSGSVTVSYGRGEPGELKIIKMETRLPFISGRIVLVEGAPVDISKLSIEVAADLRFEKLLPAPVVIRDRCFLGVGSGRLRRGEMVRAEFGFAERAAAELARIMHIPALRGTPARAYPVVGASGSFEGPFDRYTAGVISAWQTRGDEEKLSALRRDLVWLALTSDVRARKLDDTRVELLVGRMPPAIRSNSGDLVNIADVGFGVSQTLPVVVALLVAEPGQLVYLEQPEIHLHPRAQVAFSALLARAATRGVRVVVETHSSLLIRGIQTAVAEGELNPSDVILHWCGRDAETGDTNVTTGELDEAGAFGDWPEDFDDVNLDAEERYLDAAARRVVE